MSQNENYQKFINFFTLIIDSSEEIQLNKANAYSGRGLTYFLLQKYEKAIADCTKAIALCQKDNDKAKVYLGRGNAYNKLKQYENAINDYTEAIALYPEKNDKAEAYFDRDNTYEELKQYEEAKANYTEAIALYPEKNDQVDTIKVAVMLHKIALYPEKNNKADAYFGRGNAYFALQKYKKALADYTDAIVLYPEKNDQAKAYSNRGNTYKELKQYEKAIVNYTKTIKLATNKNTEAEAYFNLGITYFALQKYEKAIINYRQAIDLYPEKNDKADAYFSRGNAYNQLEQYDNAIADYKKTIILCLKDNDRAKAYLNLGITYFALQKYEKAIIDYRQAIDLSTEKNDQAKVYFGRGGAYQQLEKDKKAIADYKESIKLACKYSCTNYGKAKTFYKFCPLNKHTFDMLKEQKLYFSDIAFLNDPLECPFVQEVEFFRNTVFAECTDYEPRILSLVLPCNKPKKRKKLPKELPVENYLLFFSHYATAHTGICIEYQITKEFLQITKEFPKKKMFYTEVSYPKRESPKSIPDLFAVKNKQWEYEHEARFVAFGKKCTYPTKPGVSITKIFFGLNTSKQNKKRLYKIMKKQKNIEFFEAEKAEETLLNVKFRPYLPKKK